MTLSQGLGLVAGAQALTQRKGCVKDEVVVLETKIEITTASPDPDRYLVVSPYTEPEHLLDLETLDTENQLLALALTNLKCLRDDYATAPYLETFNWGEVIDTVKALTRGRRHSWKETCFYVVAFRSRIPPTTVYAELGTLDKAAHVEATSSGGFLKYVECHLTKLTIGVEKVELC